MQPVCQMKRCRKHRGSVFTTAIVALVVMFLIGTAFLQLAASLWHQAHQSLRAVHAMANVDAGINYMIWNQKYPTESNHKIADADMLPPTTDPDSLQPDDDSPAKLSLPPGWDDNPQDAVSVWICKFVLPSSPSGQNDGYQIISKGRSLDYRRHVRVIARAPINVSSTQYPDPTNPPPPPVLKHALFSGTGLTISGSSDILGDIGSNLDLKVNSGAARIVGDAKSGGIVTTKNSQNIIGNIYQHQPQVILSNVIQMENLYNYAKYHGNEVYNGDVSFVGDVVVENKVIYVKGDVSISANTTFSSVVTIVAEGTITINGNVQSVGPSDFSNLLLVSPNSINVRLNGNADIYATIIAPGVNAYYSGNGSATILGGVVANSINSSGDINVRYRQPNPDAVIIPPPPVHNEYIDSSLEWTIASWHQLN